MIGLPSVLLSLVQTDILNCRSTVLEVHESLYIHPGYH